MTYDQFIDRVTEQVGGSREQAETLIKATLLTLADRITGGEARDLAAQLPQELREYLSKASEPAQAFGLEDFIARVRLRAGVDADTARRGVEAVFKALYAAVSSGEFEDVMAQLPKEFHNLVPAVVRRR